MPGPHDRGLQRLLPFALAVLASLAPALAAGAPPPVPVTPPGYSIVWSEARSAPPGGCAGKQGDYACSIQRVAEGPEASRILGIAEAVYPPRDLIGDLATREGYEMGSDTAGVPLWWCRGMGARRIPYSATRGALDYYLKLTQKYRDHDYRVPGDEPMFSSELVYRATISRRKTYETGDKEFADVYVASIAMSWTYDDGTFIPEVTAHRTVVLTPHGDVLEVDGDGQGGEDVTFSTHRGMGRSTELRR
ncbi:MAG TPA: hypothetical protein VK123_11420 [Candidatus Limnocylindrales bacterium]|nr:hypothetical protein [Candidatus Limnocylindrales bacterium]